MAIEKIKILGAVLELPAKQHCQFSPFGPIFEVNGLDWHCCLASSSKTAPRILIFSIAIGADYSYEMKNSEIYRRPYFSSIINSFIATVQPQRPPWPFGTLGTGEVGTRVSLAIYLMPGDVQLLTKCRAFTIDPS